MDDYYGFAQVYDEVSNESFFTQLLALVLRYSRRYPPSGKRLLDLACGTGTVTVELARRGWQPIGIDLSEAMLSRARAKADEAGVHVDFRVGDMRDFTLEHQADLVVCAGDSINHLRDEDDVRRTLESVARCLATGGIFIFDVNTPQALRHRWTEEEVSGSRGGISFVWKPSFDEDSATRIFDAEFIVHDGDRTHVFEQQIRERAFELDTLQDMLLAAGMISLEKLDFWTADTVTDESDRAMFVAQEAGSQSRSNPNAW